MPRFCSVFLVPHTHDIEMSEGVVRKTFVTWSQSEPAREWRALVDLDTHAPGLAPRPIAQLDVAGRPAVMMSRVPGEPMSGVLSPRQIEALGSAMRRLFDVPVPAELPVRANDPGTFQQEFRSWLEGDYAWNQCQDPLLVRRAVEAARSWLDRHQPAQNWLVDPVLALGDGNLDNVLWDGEECRLIDWEEYGVSDLCYEIADVVEHASSRLGGCLNIDAFLAEFVLTSEQRERVEHHRRMFACFWLAMLLPGNGGWLRNPPGSTEKQAHWVVEVIGQLAGLTPSVGTTLVEQLAAALDASVLPALPRA